VLNLEKIREYLDNVPPPWVLKPRHSASAIGIRKLDDPEEVWRLVEELGDQRSYHLLERFVPGDVFHVDSIVWARDIRFAEAHGYLNPPFDVYHGGGLFCTRTLERGSHDERALKELNDGLARALGMVRGALHTEFIRGAEDGRLYFLETAARVGGAYIADVVEAATGINLWREWARLEVADARGDEYALPPRRHDYSGIVLSLARQEWPDMSAYTDPEIVTRLHKRHHAGLIVASHDAGRVRALLESYMRRFREDFHASLPPPQRAADAVD
jgi:biotin carboxylase